MKDIISRRNHVRLPAPKDYFVLLALMPGRAHGADIQGQILADTLAAGYPPGSSLYRELARLVRAGYIEPVGRHQRENVYGITTKGRAVIESETRILMHIVQIARSRCGI